MEKVETIEQACQYLREGEILCYQDKMKWVYCGIRNGSVHIQGTQVHYVLSLKDFMQVFVDETFYIYEGHTPLEISKEKDEEYYRWQHK